MRIKKKLRKFRQSPAYNIFVGVLLAMIMFEILKYGLFVALHY